MCDREGDKLRSRPRHHVFPERGWVQFLLLMLINERPMYGYEISEELEKRGFVRHGRFETGSLYTILNRMEDHGTLTSEQEESESGRTRRVYNITEKGREYLRTGLEHMLRRKKLLEDMERYYRQHFPDAHPWQERKMYREYGHHWRHCGPRGFMTVDEEVEMLEKAKEHLEAQLANVNARLEKLKK
jgi:PadR family transcriptional regulator PadR